MHVVCTHVFVYACMLKYVWVCTEMQALRRPFAAWVGEAACAYVAVYAYVCAYLFLYARVYIEICMGVY